MGSPGKIKVIRELTGERHSSNLAEEEPVVEVHVDEIGHEGDLQDGGSMATITWLAEFESKLNVLIFVIRNGQDKIIINEYYDT